MTRFLPVFGGQISLGLPSMALADKARDVVLMMEVPAEAVRPRHHKKKIAFLLSAMCHFAHELRGQGWRVGNPHQHSGRLTAMPPVDVSLYFRLISLPVSSMTRMQLSRGMK